MTLPDREKVALFRAEWRQILGRMDLGDESRPSQDPTALSYGKPAYRLAKNHIGRMRLLWGALRLRILGSASGVSPVGPQGGLGGQGAKPTVDRRCTRVPRSLCVS